MAKQTTEKKEFAWDTENKIGEFGDNKKKTEVRICTLNGKTYVSAQSYVMSTKTNDWKRTKNNTMEMSLFKGLSEFVSAWEKTDIDAALDAQETEGATSSKGVKVKGKKNAKK